MQKRTSFIDSDVPSFRMRNGTNFSIDGNYNLHFRNNFDALESSFKEDPDPSETHFKLFRGVDKSNCSLVVWKIMQFVFFNHKKLKEEKKKKEIEKKINEIEELENEDVIELDDNGNIVGHDRLSRGGSSVNEITKQKDIDILKAQINALVNETQRIRRMANWKRQCAFMLSGVVKALEPVFKRSKDKVVEISQPLGDIKKTIKDEKTTKKMFVAIGGYEGEVLFNRGVKGSKIKLGVYEKIDSSVRKECLQFLEDLRHENRSYCTRISQYSEVVEALIQTKPMIFKRRKLNKKELQVEKVKKVQEGIQDEDLENDHYIGEKPDPTKYNFEVRSMNLEDNADIKDVWELEDNSMNIQVGNQGEYDPLQLSLKHEGAKKLPRNEINQKYNDLVENTKNKSKTGIIRQATLCAETMVADLKDIEENQENEGNDLQKVNEEDVIELSEAEINQGEPQIEEESPEQAEKLEDEKPSEKNETQEEPIENKERVSEQQIESLEGEKEEKPDEKSEPLEGENEKVETLQDDNAKENDELETPAEDQPEPAVEANDIEASGDKPGETGEEKQQDNPAE